MKTLVLLFLSTVAAFAQFQNSPGVVFPKSNTVYVSSTSLREFRTGEAAMSNALAGNSIIVGSGQYTTTSNWLKRGVDYHIYADTISMPDVPIGGIGVFDDRITGATTNSIIAPGTDFLWLPSEHDVPNGLGFVVVTNADTRLTFRGNTARYGEWQASFVSNSFLHIKNAQFVDFDINEVKSSDFIGSVHGPNFFFEKAAYARVRMGRIHQDHDTAVKLIEPSGGVTSFLKFENDYLRSDGEEGILITGNSLNWTNVLILGTVIGGTTGIGIDGGRNFVQADYVTSQGNSPMTVTAGINHIRIKRIASSTSGSALTVNGGWNYFDIDQFEATTAGSHTSPLITINGGTNFFDGGRVIVTNAICLRVAGSQSTTLNNMFFEGVNSSGTGNSNECILVMTNGLRIVNTFLKSSSATVNGMKATNVNNHVDLGGLLYNHWGSTNATCTITNGVYVEGAGAPVRL